MASGKELRGKIKSVENTKKITKAMEMVSVSKMRKAQERMRAARPYSEKIRNIASHPGQANPEYVHAFMKPTTASRWVHRGDHGQRFVRWLEHQPAACRDGQTAGNAGSRQDARLWPLAARVWVS